MSAAGAKGSAGATPVLSPAAGQRIMFAEISSRALQRTLPLAVIKPARPAHADAPVMFLLHGRGRHHRSLIDSAARAALLAAPFHIVLPQGEDGWYIDSPARPADRYGAYLEEVLRWAEEHLSVARITAQPTRVNLVLSPASLGSSIFLAPRRCRQGKTIAYRPNGSRATRESGIG